MGLGGETPLGGQVLPQSHKLVAPPFSGGPSHKQHSFHTHRLGHDLPLMPLLSAV